MPEYITNGGYFAPQAFEPTIPQPTCYACKMRGGKQYALFKKEDIPAAIKYLSEFQSYVGRFYNVSTRPYRGKHYNPQKFIWLVEG